MVTNHQHYREKVSQMISWGHWFALFNILLSLVLGSRYLFVSDWPASLLGRIYAFASWLGHFSFIVFTIYLLVIFPLTFVVMSQRLLRFLSATIATIGMTLLLIDSEVFTRFYLHLNQVVWELIINPDQSELTRDWQLMFICVPVIFLMEMLFGTWCWQRLRNLNRDRLSKSLAVLFISSFFATHLMYIWADAHFYRPITMQRAKLPLSYPMTARKFLGKYGLLNQQEYQQKVIQQGNPSALAVEYPLSKIAFNNSTNQYNLLIIVVSGIDKKNVLKEMPALSSFAQSNIQFENHYSSGNREDTGLFSLFYGISPTYLDGILSARQPSELINTLNAQGYQFGLFSSDGFSAPLYRQALLADFSLPTAIKQNDNETTTQWQQWLAARNINTPWFSYVNLRAKRTQADPAVLNRSVQDADHQIHTILETLQKKDMLDNTIVVITTVNNITDRGPDHGKSTNNFNLRQLQVPLVIHWPDTPIQKINKLTSHEDIMATLMQRLLHVKNPPTDYSQGEDLFAAVRYHNWIVTGENGMLIITTPTNTLLLDNNGTYLTFDHYGNEIKNEKPQLALLLQVLTDVKRFIAN